MMVDPTRRTILKTGAAATVLAATRSFAGQAGQDGEAMSFYENGPVRIRYEEVGSGFPLLVIPGGGLNSAIAGLATHPFNPLEEFKGEHRVIAADLRNSNRGQSSGPLEIDRPWDAHTDDHLGVMDHLGIDKFMVLGFCIGGPLHLEPSAAGPRSCRRRRAGAAQRVECGASHAVLRQQHAGVGARSSSSGGPRSRRTWSTVS